MSRNILIVMFCLASNMLFAQGIEFFHGSFSEAIEKAKNEEKLIFMDAYASWCGPCKRMASMVFTQSVVGEFYNAKFINMKVDMEKDEGPELSKKFKVSAYPTLIFISPKGEIVQKHVGGMDPDAFVQLGKTALGKADFSADFAKEYENGNRSSDFMLRYITSMNKSGKSPLKITNDYLATQPDITTSENLKIIHQAAVECDSRIFGLMIKNKSAVIGLVGKDAFNEKVKQAADNTVNKAIEFQSPDLLTEAKAAVKANYPEGYEEFNYTADLKYYKSVGEMENYSKTALEYAQKYLKKDSEQLFKLASDLEAHYFNIPLAMEVAEKIAALSLKNEPKAEYYYLYARLQERNGKVKSAINSCEDGLKIVENGDIVKRKLEDYCQTLKKTIK
ncbi:MAG TPA: thioredoxin family protein [Saprospiraceae bacterium]|nr:thioredoxin family protein [Saprospiraceae bacterium]MCC6689859.1 thioredoxin family protein [Saprospiraceae bacterium]HMV23659.1 thioredoxin family protein [Saprospiraceae bacterium]HMX83375.1 thioredoxin family protein [Saprospiraceae bacterium]HMX86095.1 thioredoxin family protein [Saprospiraceae bacterium]